MKSIPYYLLLVCAITIQTEALNARQKYKTCYLQTQEHKSKIRAKRKTIKKIYDNITCIVLSIDGTKQITEKITDQQKSWNRTRTCVLPTEKELARQKHERCMTLHCDKSLKKLTREIENASPFERAEIQRKIDTIIKPCENRIEELEQKLRDEMAPLQQEQQHMQQNIEQSLQDLHTTIRNYPEKHKEVKKLGKRALRHEEQLKKLEPCPPACYKTQQDKWQKLLARKITD